MSGDYTRFTFDPLEDHFGVLMQQGRVMLDSDFNEWVETLGRQFRVRMLDTVGRCAVPQETPTGFEIQIVDESLAIGRGRAYVDGLLAENHGGDNQRRPVTRLDANALEYDPVLEERRGINAVAYEEQPYLPNAAELFPLDDEGPLLVYLDVWQREVTHVQEPDLVEKAVGVDTATRVQVVWQVKVLPVPLGTTCATPDDEIPDWPGVTASPAGRLTTNAVGVPASDDRCIIAPEGGYRGTENRLYRVEVHDGGDASNATFKWSRDNASVKATVIEINEGLDELTVERVGRDAAQRFAENDWIEVIDDHLELVQQPGTLRQILSVDEVNETITLVSPLPDEFNHSEHNARHTRIRRWDQGPPVLDAAGAIIHNIDANEGVIPISAGDGTLVLEDGVEVTFTEDPAGGLYRTGDYWVFAARTVDASVEELVAAPPKGIIHHYCRLAVVSFPNQVDNCRMIWPPDFGEGDCYCTECVSAEDHNSGESTIQMAIDRVRAEGGKVCLGPGVFNLGDNPVVISGALSIQLEGHGLNTHLIYTGGGAAVSVMDSAGVDVSSLSITAVNVEPPNLALFLQTSVNVRIEKCYLQQGSEENRRGPAVGLNGLLIEVALRDNVMYGGSGVASFAAGIDGNVTPNIPAIPSVTSTVTFGLSIENNLIIATQRGISLDQFTVHTGDTRISANRISGGSEASILVRGIVSSSVISSSRIDISNNDITAEDIGIVFATDNTRVIENDIGVNARLGNQQLPSHGILFDGGLLQNTIERSQVLSNRITGMSGDGIRIQASVGSTMIKQNIIQNTSGGIVMHDRATADMLSIENNQLLNVDTTNNVPIYGIRAFQSQQVAIAGNLIEAFAVNAVGSPRRVAIEVIGSRTVRVAGNDLRRIGPPGGFVGSVSGIEVAAPFDRVDVLDNSASRIAAAAVVADNSTWNGIVIRRPISVEDVPPDETLPPATLGRATVFTTLNDDEVLVLTSARAVVVPRGAEIAGVRGNQVDGYGAAFAASMLIDGALVFSDNRFVYAISQQFTAPVVRSSSGSAVVSSNHIERRLESDNLTVLDITTQSNQVTVLGNICLGGRILLQGAPLADPWSPLNVSNS